MTFENLINMNTLKFRVWDKVDNVYWNTKDGLYFCLNLTDPNLGVSISGFLEDKRKTRFVVQQFTGLLDSNGKEIYEGDIVKASKPNSYLDGEYIVAWHEKKGRWYYSNQPTYKDLYQVGSSGNLWCEVIGNIFETPDLIKN